LSTQQEQISMELVGKQGVVYLRDKLNDAIDELNDWWRAMDESMDIVPVRAEHIERDNFYYGHRPSLIEAPVDRYPNCSVLAYNARPGAENSSQDQQLVYDVTMYIELMVRSLDNEEECNARAQRTLDATHSCMLNLGAIGGLWISSAAPVVTITDVFVRPEVKGHGPRWLWQGVRMDYTLQRYIPT
jgi:hypothetical protein